MTITLTEIQKSVHDNKLTLNVRELTDNDINVVCAFLKEHSILTLLPQIIQLADEHCTEERAKRMTNSLIGNSSSSSSSSYSSSSSKASFFSNTAILTVTSSEDKNSENLLKRTS
jgi:type IV secretory pathway TraG/TraD family ATPase VirD4